MNVPHPFEVLRRVPLDLAAKPVPKLDAASRTEESCAEPHTKMMSLFQPLPAGRRLFEWAVQVLTALSLTGGREVLSGASSEERGGPPIPWWRIVLHGVRVYGSAAWRSSLSCRCAGLLGLLFVTSGFALVLLPVLQLLQELTIATQAMTEKQAAAYFHILSIVLIVIGHALIFAAVLLWTKALWRQVTGDIVRGVVQNGFGFCSGMSRGGDRYEGFTEWMHRGIQKAAGLSVDQSAPLTFGDLWNAPRPEGVIRSGADRALPENRGIDLEIVVANVTHGRPYRFPLHDKSVRLYYRRAEWENLFPTSILNWLDAHSRPYVQTSPSDPSPADSTAKCLRELPTADLPVLVAARMSMSFPLLFSTVPVYAVDFEANPADRRLRKCRLADGGLCSNFPIHLFDSVWPRWPLFGLWLSQRLRSVNGVPVSLPRMHTEGHGDNWLRFEPSTDLNNNKSLGGLDEPGKLSHLAGYVAAVISTMKDWNDRSTMRLPHVRNRVVRLALQPHEGQLHIAMPGETMLHMAHQYGTGGGKILVERFCSNKSGHGTQAWGEHLYVRVQVLLRSIHRLLNGLGEAVAERRHSPTVNEVLTTATGQRPLESEGDIRFDESAKQLSRDQALALLSCIDDLVTFEKRLGTVLRGVPYDPFPVPELQTRPPH